MPGAAAGDTRRTTPWEPVYFPHRTQNRAALITPGNGACAGNHECSPQIASQPCGDSFPQENLLMFKMCQSRPSRPPPEHRIAHGPRPHIDGPARRACVRSVTMARFTWIGQRRRNSPGRNHPFEAGWAGREERAARVETAPHPTTARQTPSMVSTRPARRASRPAQPALIGMLSAGLFHPEVHAVPRVEDRSNRNRHGFVVPQRVGKTPSSSWTWSASAGAPYSEIS